MKFSISNIAWKSTSIEKIAPRLLVGEISGIEIAPTLIWDDFPDTQEKEISAYKSKLMDFGLQTSGIQSLLFGHPEFQILDPFFNDALHSHLSKVIQNAALLGSSIAVFGSPKNRLRKEKSLEEAFDSAVNFFKPLISVLEENNVVLTLEPNAPQYGADFLVDYEEVMTLSILLDSPWIQPQIDTGCLQMANEDPSKSFGFMLPKHIHISKPNLAPIGSDYQNEKFLKQVQASEYDGWITLEMLTSEGNALNEVSAAINWLNDFRIIY